MKRKVFISREELQRRFKVYEWNYKYIQKEFEYFQQQYIKQINKQKEDRLIFGQNLETIKSNENKHWESWFYVSSFYIRIYEMFNQVLNDIWDVFSAFLGSRYMRNGNRLADSEVLLNYFLKTSKDHVLDKANHKKNVVNFYKKAFNDLEELRENKKVINLELLNKKVGYKNTNNINYKKYIFIEFSIINLIGLWPEELHLKILEESLKLTDKLFTTIKIKENIREQKKLWNFRNFFNNKRNILTHEPISSYMHKYCFSEAWNELSFLITYTTLLSNEVFTAAKEVAEKEFKLVNNELDDKFSKK